MKKFDFDKKYVQIAILALLVLIFSTLFEQFLGNITVVFANAKRTIDFISRLLRPFFIAFVIAYFLNPMVRYIENKILVKNDSLFKTDKSKRKVSIFITYVFAIFIVYLLVASILPSVVKNVNTLIVTLPESVNAIKDLVSSYSERSSVVSPLIETANNLTNQNYTPSSFITKGVKIISDAIFNLPHYFSQIIVGIVTFANGVIAILIGFVISIYMINDKEYFLEHTKKIVCVLTKDKGTERIFRVTKMSNHILERFIIGKAIDSFIIGVMFFVICIAFKVPYAPLFALIIGVTNMIPYFGPFIGAVPVLIITISWNYKMFIPLGLSILILQQFDGIILGPKILGDSIGLKPISIIFAILVGGGLFGVAGMFLGAPVYAVLATIVNEVIHKNYLKKTQEK